MRGYFLALFAIHVGKKKISWKSEFLLWIHAKKNKNQQHRKLMILSA
jgi:hypothetical protein